MGILDIFTGARKGSQPETPERKPGRNEPCWCGSGKKYKKCHLPDEEQKAAERACSHACGPT